MAQRRVLQFDHCDDETRFEIEIVKELNNLKEKNMQNESTHQRISEENITTNLMHTPPRMLSRNTLVFNKKI